MIQKLLRPKRILILVVVLAVAARLAYVVLFGHTLNLRLSGYDTYATNLLAGHGYTRFADLHPDSDLPPLYSFFLAAVYTVFGRSAIPVALIQIVFDAVTMITIYAIARRMAGDNNGEWVGVLAAAFVGFYPYLLFQNLTANDTCIFIMLVALGVWCLYRLHETSQWRWAFVTGLLFGLAALTKTLVALTLPIIALWWWRAVGFKTAFKYAITLGVGFALITFPWIVRNTALNGELTFISTNDGTNLAQGNNPCSIEFLINAWDVQWTQDNPRCMGKPPADYNDKEQTKWYRNQAINYLTNNLSSLPQLIALKFMNLWSPEIMPRSVPPDAVKYDNAVDQYDGGVFQIARTIHLFYFTPLLILGVFGWWRAWRDKQTVLPILISPAAVTISYLIYHTSTRYRSPADPFVFVGAAYGVMWLWNRIQARSKGQANTS
jgi:4-amino-4-deoxy-L-arabinose transferase-like glycosyltransferase